MWKLSFAAQLRCTHTHTHTYIYMLTGVRIYIYIYICSQGFVNNLTSSQTKPQYNVWNVPRPALQDNHFYPKQTFQPITEQVFLLSVPTHTHDNRLLLADFQTAGIEAMSHWSHFVLESLCLQAASVCFVLLSLWRRHCVTVASHHVNTSMLWASIRASKQAGFSRPAFSKLFFQWGPLLLVRRFHGPPYSCPLWKQIV
jgi:hypothetical protein